MRHGNLYPKFVNLRSNKCDLYDMGELAFDTIPGYVESQTWGRVAGVVALPVRQLLTEEIQRK